MNDVDPHIQEQAFCILQNLAEDEDGIALVFSSMGEDLTAACISAGLDCSSEPVTREVRRFQLFQCTSPWYSRLQPADRLLSGQPFQRHARTAGLHFYSSAPARPHPLVHGGWEIGRALTARVVRAQPADEQPETTARVCRRRVRVDLEAFV